MSVVSSFYKCSVLILSPTRKTWAGQSLSGDSMRRSQLQTVKDPETKSVAVR